MTDHAHDADSLVRLLGVELEQSDADHILKDERLVTWLARDLRSAMTDEERVLDERAADAFAQRARSRLLAAQAFRALPAFQARTREPSIRATVAQSIQAAAFARCAPVLDLAAAAGSGRVLWDELCDSWLELPDDIPASRHVAIRVAGESMLPVLHPRDVILVKLDARPSDGEMVVARLGDDGYVVKRYGAGDSATVELSSFNPDYAPIVMPRARVSILGTVVARFSVSAKK